MGSQQQDSELRNIFDKCQHRSGCLTVSLDEIQKYYMSSNCSDFWKEFKPLLNITLKSACKAEPVERLLSLIAEFFNSKILQIQSSEPNEYGETITSPLFTRLLKTCINMLTCRVTSVRQRACILIGKLLQSLEDESVLDDETFEIMVKKLMFCLRDRVATVRAEAVLALSRTQDPTNKRCPTIEALVFHLTKDPYADVRKAVLKVLAASSVTLKPLLSRTRDVSDDVRKEAYLFFANRIRVTSLSIDNRIRLLTDGLRDRSSAVNEVVTKQLIPNWVRQVEDDLIRFVHLLDPQGSHETTEQVLKVIFESREAIDLVRVFKDNYMEDGVVAISKLNTDTAIYWKALLKHAHGLKGSGGELIDQLLPALTLFSSYVAKYVQTAPDSEADTLAFLEHKFISQQLLEMLHMADFSDVVGQSLLRGIVSKFLISQRISAFLLPQLIALMPLLYDRKEHLILEEVMAAISEIEEPIAQQTQATQQQQTHQNLGADVAVMKLRVKLNCLREELQECIKAQDFAVAQELKVKINDVERELSEMQNSEEAELDTSCVPLDTQTVSRDPVRLHRSLILLAEMLSQVDFHLFHPSLQTYLDSTILSSVANEDPAVRLQAVRCVVYCALLNKTVAVSNMMLITQVALLDQENIRICALQGVFDMLLMYGLGSFSGVEQLPDVSEPCDVDDPCRIINFLASFLDNESNKLRRVAVHGFCKLFFLGHLYSPTIFCHLVLLWFSPSSSNDSMLTHVLGLMFEKFPLTSESAIECIESAFLPVLRTLFDAPVSSPLCEIDIPDVCEFLMCITEHGFLTSDPVKEKTVHDRLAESVSNEILNNPDSINVRHLALVLSKMQLSEFASIKTLKALLVNIVNEVEDPSALKCLKKYEISLSKLPDDFDYSAQSGPSSRGANTQKDNVPFLRLVPPEEEPIRMDDKMPNVPLTPSDENNVVVDESSLNLVIPESPLTTPSDQETASQELPPPPTSTDNDNNKDETPVLGEKRPSRRDTDVASSASSNSGSRRRRPRKPESSPQSSGESPASEAPQRKSARITQTPVTMMSSSQEVILTGSSSSSTRRNATPSDSIQQSDTARAATATPLKRGAKKMAASEQTTRRPKKISK